MVSRRHTPAGAALTELVVAIFRVNGLLLAAGDRLAAPLGLTSARWQVMGALSDGPLTVAQVARNMGLQRQSVQRLVNVLHDEGLLTLDPNPHHRRAMLVRLSREGERRLAAVTRSQIEWINALAADTPLPNINSALQLLGRLEGRLQG